MNTNSPGSCVTCGEAMVPGAAYCRACGARQEQPTCSRCEAPVAPGAAFCRSCGAPVGEAPPAPAPPPSPVEPSLAPTAVKPASPPPQRQRGGSRRTPLLIAAAILLIGAGAAAAILLARGGGADSTTTVAGAATRPTTGSEDEPGEEAAEPDSDGFPTVSRAEMEEEVQALLLAYHEDVVAGDYRSAWALLSARKRQQNLAEYGYRKWMEAQASLSGYLAPEGLRARIDGLEDEGVARVDVSRMGWSDPGSRCSEWSGLTWVRYERGTWAYDPGYSTTPARRRTWQPRRAELLGANC